MKYTYIRIFICSVSYSTCNVPCSRDRSFREYYVPIWSVYMRFNFISCFSSHFSLHFHLIFQRHFSAGVPLSPYRLTYGARVLLRTSLYRNDSNNIHTQMIKTQNGSGKMACFLIFNDANNNNMHGDMIIWTTVGNDVIASGHCRFGKRPYVVSLLLCILYVNITMSILSMLVFHYELNRHQRRSSSIAFDECWIHEYNASMPSIDKMRVHHNYNNMH